MNTETKLDISTPKEQLPTKGFSVIVEAPQGYPIRDNARGKIIALCSELSEATRIARALASQPELLIACKSALDAIHEEKMLQAKRGESVHYFIGTAQDFLEKAITKARGGAA